MTYDVITCLFYALLAALFLQPSWERFAAAAIFMLATLSHELYLSALDGLAYYGSAALFDLGVVTLLSCAPAPSKLVIGLQQVCTASIFLNAAGWLLWFFYFPPLAYDLAFAVLYAWTLYIMLRKDQADVGDHSLAIGGFSVRRHRGAGPVGSHKHEGET